MKFRFIAQERRWHRIEDLCRAVKVSRGAYYAWLKRRPSPRDHANVVLLSQIRRVHRESKERYGSPRVHAQLRHEGWPCSRKRVERLMRDDGKRGKHGVRRNPKTTNSDHDLPIARNILNREFDRQRPNEAWVADITFIPTQQGWLYLAAVMELFSRKIVGWAVGDRITRDLPLRALHMAAQRRRPPAGLIHHSDRGSQYASKDFQEALRSYGMICSMSRKGNCHDNAPMESWFHSLKVELVHDECFVTRQQAFAELFEYIEVFYNRQRLHTSIGSVSPVAFEREFMREAA